MLFALLCLSAQDFRAPVNIQNKPETGEKWKLGARRLLSDSSQKMGWHA